MSNVRFRMNPSEVMSETIEGEVIAINLVSGNYYSVMGAGAEIWAFVNQSGPVSASEIVDVLVRQFDAPTSTIDAAVTLFLSELRDEGLITETEVTDQLRPVAVPLNNAPRRAFEPPRLETYTDMQDLVLLDPVHQVADTGWPRAQDDTAPEARLNARSA